MTTDIEQKLMLRMEANMRGVERALNKLDRDASASGRHVANQYRDAGRRVEASFQRMQRSVTAALGAIGVGLSARALQGLITDSLQAAESLSDLSNQVNANVEGLQTLRFTVDQNGGSADLLDRGLRRLAEGMGRVLAGEANEATRAMEQLGLTSRIQSGEIRTTDELFRALADSLQGLETQQERTAMASLIFGQRMGVQLSQSLSLGSEGMAEFEDRARAAGMVLEEGIVRQGAAVNAELRAMGQELQTRLNGAVLENADALREMSAALGEVLRAAIDVTAAFARMFQEPAGRNAVTGEIERLQARLETLRSRGDGSGAIPALQDRIATLRERLDLTVDFQDFAHW